MVFFGASDAGTVLSNSTRLLTNLLQSTGDLAAPLPYFRSTRAAVFLELPTCRLSTSRPQLTLG